MLLAVTASSAAWAANTLNLSYEVVGLYDDKSYDTPNYYIVLSDSESARYDNKTGSVKLDAGYIVVLDLYNLPSDPLALQPGTYESSDAMTKFTVNPDESKVQLYIAGKPKTATIESPVVVSVDNDGVYTVTATAIDPLTKDPLDLKYVGRLPIVNVYEKPASFPMLKKDLLNLNLDKGGIAYYYGVTDYSNNGVTYLNLYSEKFDQTTGSLVGDGINLAMMIAHKRMNKTTYCIEGGTYVDAKTFERNTWYPCREIEYTMGSEYISMPFGSFIRIRENGGEYVYGYLKSGTLTFSFDPATKQLTGHLDAYTDFGYHVTAELSGNILYDFSNAYIPSAVSNLTDDVDLDLDYLEKGRMWHMGEKAGCRAFVLDLGSPAGRDSEPGVAADLMRIEFFVPKNSAVVAPGVYTVVPNRWNENELNSGGTYEPITIGQGWSDVDGGSSYRHFQKDLTYVYDLFAPVESGSVKVETTDYSNYTFEINLYDDAGYAIRGLWNNKPVELQYDREALEKELAGVESVSADADGGVSAIVNGRHIIVVNGGDAAVTLFDMNGRAVMSGDAAFGLDASALASGVYVLAVKDKAFKVILK